MKKIFSFFIALAAALTSFATDRVSSLPCPILGGELSNSATTSVADIDEVMPRMRALGLNTVLVPAYWELMEPVEGKFDFTLIDHTIDVARQEHLHVVFLWFGVWKNSMSCYTPAWFNIMMQIENEIGMLESARDHSPLAEKAYNKERLRVGASAGMRWAERYGTDEYADEKFMALSYARYVEHLAKAARDIHDMPLYVNAAMNSRGRRPGEYPSAGPLAHLIDFWHEGAPSIDLLAPDIYDTGFKSWCAQYAMPLRPQDGGEIKNRLFIPESRCCENSGVRALYAFGEHQALGFSPFAIDQASAKETESVTKAYRLLCQLAAAYSSTKDRSVASHSSLFTLHSSLKTWGLLFDQEDRERIIDDDGVVMTCRHYFTLPWDPRATDGSTWPEGGAMLIRLGKYDYLLAGSGVVIDFKTPTEKQQEQKKQLGEDGFAEAAAARPEGTLSQSAASERNSSLFTGKRLGLLSVDEVSIADDGTMQYLRRHNGDQTHQGRHARIGVGEWKLLHIKLYEY